MPSRIKSYAVILALFFIEAAIFDKLRIYGVKPEFLLIATIFFGFHSGAVYGLEMGFFSGSLEDIFGITAFGVNTFPFLALGFLAGLVKEKLFRDSVITQFLFSGACVFVLAGFFFWYMGAILKCGAGADFWKLSFVKAAYTACSAPAVFFVLGKIHAH